MLYELRTYHVIPDTKDEYIKQWAEITHPLFMKHGFRPMGYWMEDKEDATDLFYILAWDDMKERDERFGAFQSDPLWVETREKRRAAGGASMITGIDNSFWNATSFSPAP